MLPTGAFSAGWVELNYTLSPSGTGIVADLAPLNGSAPVQNPTSMVAAKPSYTPFTVLTPGSLVNVSAPGLGSLSLDTSSGSITLCDAQGLVLAATSAAPAAGAAMAWPHLSGGLP